MKMFLRMVGSLAFAGILLASSGAQAGTDAGASPLVLRYAKPAANWEQEGLPIGNGAMGAVLLGGVTCDDIPFNEKTLWTGGPGARGGYDGGLPPKTQVGLQAEKLAKVRALIARDGKLDPKKAAAILGHEEQGPGAYQSFGNLQLTFAGAPQKAEGYRRSLDIGRALATLVYRADGVSYRRDYFASYPDRVIVIRLQADRSGKVSFSAAIREPDNRTAKAVAAAGRLTVRGALNDNGEVYEAGLQVMQSGGTLTSADGRITVAGADSAWLILAAGTDYAMRYPDYRGADPHAGVKARLDAAMAKGYGRLLAAHVADYTALFDRFRLDLGQKMPEMPTDALIAAYKKDSTGPAARALEALFFQYGRYLLIASSRPGSLPPNLQGVWNPSATPPWSDDYHVNINLQMNYWLADPANLGETATPFFDFVDSLVTPGRIAAKRILGAKGWTLFLKTNIWGQTGIISWPTAFWQPEAGAWLASQYYDHYRFTGDADFLKKRAWPVMKGAAEVWLDALVPDPRDGTLVVSPSYSPEHGPFSDGAAMSQQIVWGLFTDVADAAAVVKDTAFRDKVVAARAMLDPGLRIGHWGQLQEWKSDWDDPSDHHRHTSHLYALHPGHQISPRTTPDFARAARVSLEARGDSLTANGEAGTGWSKAWKVNFWARLDDGDRAYALYRGLLRENAMSNLWDAYVGPTFQIDGNFGATAGVCEMLLQSQTGEIDILPALPSAWDTGSVSGIRARGDVTADISWQHGRAQKVVLAAGRDGTLRLRSTIFSGPFTLTNAAGVPVPTEGKGALRTFKVYAGHRYILAVKV